jgi:hypothetical protein
MTTQARKTRAPAKKAASSAPSRPEPDQNFSASPLPKNATLHARVRWVQQRVPNVEKTGTVSFGKTKFDHMQEHGLIEILRPLLRQAEIGWYIDILSTERNGNHVQLSGFLVVFNDQGDEIKTGITNEGVDANDKATNKALTGLTKYALQKFFNVPTEAIDDNETLDTPKSPQTPGAPAPTQSGLADESRTELVRQTIAAAVREGHLTNARVKALLQGTYNVETLGELSEADLTTVANWVVTQVKDSKQGAA